MWRLQNSKDAHDVSSAGHWACHWTSRYHSPRLITNASCPLRGIVDVESGQIYCKTKHETNVSPRLGDNQESIRTSCGSVACAVCWHACCVHSMRTSRVPFSFCPSHQTRMRTIGPLADYQQRLFDVRENWSCTAVTAEVPKELCPYLLQRHEEHSLHKRETRHPRIHCFTRNVLLFVLALRRGAKRSPVFHEAKLYKQPESACIRWVWTRSLELGWVLRVLHFVPQDLLRF